MPVSGLGCFYSCVTVLLFCSNGFQGKSLAVNSGTLSDNAASVIPQDGLNNTESPVSSHTADPTTESRLPAGTVSQPVLLHNNGAVSDEFFRSESTTFRGEDGDESSAADTSSVITSCKEFALSNEVDSKLFN